MPTKLLQTTITPNKAPKVVFFAFKEGLPQTQKNMHELSFQITQLVIEDGGKGVAGPHHLQRLDPAGKLVWSTEHPSLKETLWHAEFEYGIAESAWKKS